MGFAARLKQVFSHFGNIESIRYLHGSKFDFLVGGGNIGPFYFPCEPLRKLGSGPGIAFVTFEESYETILALQAKVFDPYHPNKLDHLTLNTFLPLDH